MSHIGALTFDLACAGFLLPAFQPAPLATNRLTAAAQNAGNPVATQHADFLRSASRDWLAPIDRMDSLGSRLARSLDQ